jgi:choline dehydrogenase-like flavoprotein
MTVEGLRGSDGDLQIETDLCIVGGGPAGLSIAGEFANSGARILIAESGDLKEEEKVDVLTQFENVGTPRPMALRRRRGGPFGGSFHGSGCFSQVGPSTSNEFQS